MVLDAGEGEPVLEDADDRGDHADALAGRLQDAALLDMRLEVAAVTALLQLDARRLVEASGLQRIAHAGAVVAMARGVDVGLGEAADEGLAAQHAAPMALLIGPRGDIDGEMRRLRIFSQCPRHLEAVDHAHHAVEPAAARLGVGVRAHQQPRSAPGAAANHVADAIDHRLEPRLLHAAGEPASAFDVLRRQMRAMHAGLVAAEFGDAPQVAQESFAVDAGHMKDPSLGSA
jgi:hypothetical protein